MVYRQPVRYRPRRRRSSGNGSTIALVVIVVAVIALAVQHKDGDKPKPPAVGNARQLAANVLALSKDIVLTAPTRAALSAYVKTGKLTNFCGDKSQPDPLLLQVLLKLQRDGYRVLINNFGIGSDRERRLCFDSHGNRVHDQHVAGRAVDLNGIVKKGGPQTNWGGIQFRSGGEMRAIQAYADAWLAFLPRNRGGVGQEGCLNGRPQRGGFHVKIPSGSTNTNPASFTDTCDHLHLDVRVR